MNFNEWFFYLVLEFFSLGVSLVLKDKKCLLDFFIILKMNLVLWLLEYFVLKGLVIDNVIIVMRFSMCLE